MSLVITMAGGLAPLEMAAGGLLGDLSGKNVPVVFASCGATAAIFTLGAALNKPFRYFLAEKPQDI